MAITTKQLLRQIQNSNDRMEMARILVELADRAEHNVMVREILRKTVLPPPFNMLEYIKPNNRRGYWARKPCWRDYPTKAQLQARLQFSKINYSLFGTKGTFERPDGTRIGRVNQLAGNLMRSRKIVSKQEREEGKKQKAIERIARLG